MSSILADAELGPGQQREDAEARIVPQHTQERRQVAGRRRLRRRKFAGSEGQRVGIWLQAYQSPLI